MIKRIKMVANGRRSKVIYYISFFLIHTHPYNYLKCTQTHTNSAYPGGATIPVTVRPKMFTKDSEITVPNVLRKLHEIISVRGKKNTDNSEQMLLLEELRKFALDKNLGVMIDVKIMFNMVSSIFDYNISVSNCMRTETWERFNN